MVFPWAFDANFRSLVMWAGLIENQIRHKTKNRETSMDTQLTIWEVTTSSSYEKKHIYERTQCKDNACGKKRESQ